MLEYNFISHIFKIYYIFVELFLFLYKNDLPVAVACTNCIFHFLSTFAGIDTTVPVVDTRYGYVYMYM